MKKLAELTTGTHFFFGGIEWVKLDTISAGTLSLAVQPVFERAFDENNCNDWRKSSLRRELNGAFLDALVAEGADRAAFLDWESDLTADDGMSDYGTSADKIALLSDTLYRKYQKIIPTTDNWCWNLTPWTCKASNSYNVRRVSSSGVLSHNDAYYGNVGVRPLCYLDADILVSIPGEESDTDDIACEFAEKQDAAHAVLEVLNDYPVRIWGEVLGFVVACLLQTKQEAEEILQEEKAKQAAEG